MLLAPIKKGCMIGHFTSSLALVALQFYCPPKKIFPGFFVTYKIFQLFSLSTSVPIQKKNICFFSFPTSEVKHHNYQQDLGVFLCQCPSEWHKF
jgi:hypothetical protein